MAYDLYSRGDCLTGDWCLPGIAQCRCETSSRLFASAAVKRHASGNWPYWIEVTFFRLRVGRSEERRVGKECRAGWVPDHEKKNSDRTGKENGSKADDNDRNLHLRAHIHLDCISIRI